MTNQSRPQFVRTNSAQLRAASERLPAPAAVPKFDVKFETFDSSDPELAGDRSPPIVPETTYSKTEALHRAIDLVLARLKIVRAEDLVAELGLTRTNADFHLAKMAADGRLCLGIEPHRGQIRYVAARDFRVLAEIVEPVPVVRPGESAPPPAPRPGDSGTFRAVRGQRRRSSRPPRKAAGNGAA
jgi:hypothetical protein